MPKFAVYASETVYYMKDVEADDEEQVKKMIFNGEIDFDYGDIADGANFNVDEIVEDK